MPHIHEKIDFTAKTLIVHGDRVLLRKHDKYRIWLAVGGHIELDEDPVQAVIREAKEEVGLDIRLLGSARSFPDEPGKRDLIPPHFLNRHNINETHEHVSLIYVAVSDSDKVVPSGDDRSDEWKWFNREELDDPAYGITGQIRFYAKRALEIAQGKT